MQNSGVDAELMKQGMEMAVIRNDGNNSLPLISMNQLSEEY